MDCLHSYGMADSLNSLLISLTSDCAAVIRERNNGVGELFEEKFPLLILWHYSNHRLEFSVADAVKSLSKINKFKAFINKL